MRVLIVGAGAIGTCVGVSLAHSGQEVTFLLRSPSAAYIRSNGMRLVKENGEVLRLPHPSIAETPEEALHQGPYDVAVLALKTYHTDAFLESIAPYRREFPPVLCLQNGVESESKLAKVLGAERVLAGSVTTAVSRKAVGDAVVERQRGVGIAKGHPLVPALYVAFQDAGLVPRLYQNAAAMKWSKLLTNLLGNATSAILDMPPAQIFAHPGLARLEIVQLREALAVMDALHLPVVDLPGVSVRALAWGAKYLPLMVARPVLQKAVGKGRGAKMPSFHIDLYGGRGRTEVDALHGAVARFGRRLHVPTPTNQMLASTLEALTQAEIPLDAFRHKPEALLAVWEAAVKAVPGASY
ncbi:MAG: ketopantoate reductase family protein [Chloroflexi bacterium]|nr:ketopantoate reductase family protein [Chloroflexota bacterium]